MWVRRKTILTRLAPSLQAYCNTDFPHTFGVWKVLLKPYFYEDDGKSSSLALQWNPAIFPTQDTSFITLTNVF
jgi:hypothetical protein